MEEQKYELLPSVIEVKNYHNDESGFFNVFMHCCIAWELRNNRIWEPHLHEVFEKYITKDSVVLEAGCHIGSHSIKLSKLSKKLYCFEPLKQSNEVLMLNLNNNNCDNTILSNKGLSDEIGTSYFDWIPIGNLGGSGLVNNPMGNPGHPSWLSKEDEKYNIDLTTIDSLNLDQLDFMKLDVEGYEPKVLLGGINTIKKYRPIITLESWSNHFGGLDFEYTKNQFKMLLDLNYIITQINPNGPDWLFLPQ